MPRKESTIENRVYVFTPLARELVNRLGEQLADPGRQEGIRAAFAELARVSCLMADSEGLTPDEVATTIRGGGA